MHITEKEANVKKGYILYDSNYTTFWKRQNYGGSKNTRGCQGFRGRKAGMHRWSTENFQEREIILILRWWIHVIIYLSQLTECTLPRATSNADYGFGATLICQGRSINRNRCTCPVGMLTVEEACLCAGGDTRDISAPSS